MKFLRNIIVFVVLSFFANVCFAADDTPTLMDLQSAMLQQKYEEAQNIAEKLVVAYSGKTELKEIEYYLALSYLGQKKFSKAADSFEKVIKSKPEVNLRDKAYLGLVDVNYLAEQYSTALNLATKLLKLSPKSEFLSLIYLKLGRCNLKLAQWKKAQDFLSKITREFPNSLEYYSARQLLEEKQFFTVQVGAFLGREGAEGLTTELKLKGEYAYIIETIDHQNRKFYRVRVGEFANLNEATRLSQKLAQSGYKPQVYP